MNGLTKRCERRQITKTNVSQNFVSHNRYPTYVSFFRIFRYFFLPTRELSFQPAAYPKENKTPGFEVESFNPGHEI